MGGIEVHLYALVWNERPILRFFLEHYRPFVDKFYLFDDGSDDGSWEYLSNQQDVILERFESDGASFVEKARQFYCEGWKRSRGSADFVIVVNIDELVHHPDPITALCHARRKGVTVIETRGWDMVGDEIPKSGPLVTQVPRGVHSKMMSKIAIFDPTAVQEINYGPGRHDARPLGRIVRPARPLFDLLHYKCLSADYLVDRYRQLGARMRTGDIEARHGVHYRQSEAQLRAAHAQLRAVAVPVLPADMKAAGLLDEPLDGVFVTKLRRVTNEKGGLREIWRDDDPCSIAAKQAYLTVTAPGGVKAWYLHETQVDQITPISGSGKLVLWDRRRNSRATPPVVIDLDADDPVLVVIPAGIWHGFRANRKDPFLLLHLNGQAFDHVRIDEMRLPEDDPTIPFRWSSIE